MSAPVRPAPNVPRLHNGDSLTRDEFERRYAAMPEVKKAELIEGVVFMPSPVRFEQHGSPHAKVISWLGVYSANTPFIHVADNTTVRLDAHNEYQPDALLLIDPARGGQVSLDADGYIAGAPELVAEVAASSVSIDRNLKMRVYQRCGVKEYLLWRVEEDEIDWFLLREGKYVAMTPDTAGHYRSEVYPGLWLDPRALLAGRLADVLAVLQQGLASPDHADFVARLQKGTGL